MPALFGRGRSGRRSLSGAVSIALVGSLTAIAVTTSPANADTSSLPVVQDFEAANIITTANPGIFPFGSNATDTPSLAVVDAAGRPGAPGGSHALDVPYTVGSYGGFSDDLAGAQDWSGYGGFRFWVHGGGTGQNVEYEVKDGGTDGEHAELWQAFFADDFTGWKHIETPFSSFVKRTDYQPGGAPSDGVLNLTSMWGFAVNLPQSSGDLQFDDVTLYGQAAPQVSAAGLPYLVDAGGTARVEVTLTSRGGKPTESAVTVHWSLGVAGDTAVASTDYPGAQSGTITFPAGTVSSTKTFVVHTTARSKPSLAKTITVNLTAAGADITGAAPTIVINAHGFAYLDKTRSVSARVSDLMSRMTLADKVGQMTQAERGAVGSDVRLSACPLPVGRRVRASAAHGGLARDVRRAARPARRAALLLGLPALLFLSLAFIAPITSLLGTAIANPEVRQVLPRTLDALAGWNGTSLPDETVFGALAGDLRQAEADRTAALVGKRLNYELPGMRSILLASARMATAVPDGPWQPRFLNQNEAWGHIATWQVLARNAHPWTAHYLLTALDLQQSPAGGISRADPENAIFLLILARTLLIAAEVTALTLVLGFPVAYILATAPPRVAALLMLLVLLPLWTSLLVRTTAWIVLLQSDGVINDALRGLGVITHPLQLIYTRLGTVTAMVHIQLPFTILPMYSVMRGIPAAQMRAARSLGASSAAAFWRVYAPQSLPGIVAGGLITFILSLGYYITPALVGGPTDQMMSNFISTYINRDLNWGLAAALGTVLLVVTLVIYAAFLRILGPDRVRFG